MKIIMYNTGIIIHIGFNLFSKKVKSNEILKIGINAKTIWFLLNHKSAYGKVKSKINLKYKKDIPIVAAKKVINLPRYPLPKNVSNQLQII